MANSAYNDFLRALQEKELDVKDDTPSVTLIDSADYTFSAAHSTYDNATVPAAAKVAAVAMTTPTISSAGVFDSADWVWTAVSGDQSEAIITWLDAPTTPVANPLMVFYDTGMTGMPVTPSGGNINGTVNASGWHAL